MRLFGDPPVRQYSPKTTDRSLAGVDQREAVPRRDDRPAGGTHPFLNVGDVI